MGFKTWFALAGLAVAIASPGAAAERTIAGATCSNPPRVNCPEANCPAAVREPGPAVEPKTGRRFFLDFPCDLKPNEKVVFILSLHGAGSIANWQRHYFPAVDYKEKYRLVIATPTAAEPAHFWTPAVDDPYLENVSDLVIREFGAKNIKAFWLAGHSQGGMVSRRIICSDYFKGKVDGFLSLSGGRLNPPGAPPGGPPQPAALPTCDFSFIFDVGELEFANGIAVTSPWADKYGCKPRSPAREVTDTRAGYVTTPDQSRGPSQGRFARPGVAQLMAYPGCKDGRVVADVVRLDKGHTEGLEPQVLGAILKLMVSAKGGKLAAGG